MSSYDELREALRTVRELRNISFTNLDEIAGASAGYYSHVLSPKPPKRMSINSPIWVLGGLGVKCLIVEDPEALARIRPRMT